MNKKIIMVYDLKGNDSNRIMFNRELFEYNLHSHNGKYNTKSKGILKEYSKLTRAVIIFNDNDLKKVKKLLKKYSLFYKLYEISKEIK